MSGIAPASPPPLPAPRAPRPRFAVVASALADPVTRELTLRFVTFLALAMFAAFHWATLVEDAPAGRVAGVVLISAAGGLVLALAGVLAGARRWIAGLAALAAALGTIWLSFLAVGLPGEMLPPAGWGELGELVDRGLKGLQTVDWPYGGDDPQVRLTLLLAVPALVAPAAVLAFWPDERLQPVLRAQGLILLLALYGVAVTEREPEAPLLQGLILLVLIAAWLWLPRMRLNQAGAAVAVVCGAGLVALPFAAGFDADRPWIDYEEWRWAQSSARADTFDWDHSYGPIDWPRDGRTVLNVRSDKAHYWKAQVLGRFDGFRWLGSSPGLGTRQTFDAPAELNRQWEERISFTVRTFSSELVVGAGAIYDIDLPDREAIPLGDGTARVLDGPLEEGESYSVGAYVPDPSAADMRVAPQRYEDRYREHTYFSLPQPGQSAQGGPTAPGDVARSAATPPELVSPGLRGDPNDPGTVNAQRKIARSPYGRTYRLARSLAAGQPTVYDVVKRVESHLRDNYSYTENPPRRDIPLAAFLFQDRRGYCQQFSGAMALLLRMNGIPARVAAGFSPGVRDQDRREFRVRDLDAHSWVEVYFSEIGWVPFDPTPGVAPAESQSGGPDATSAARGDAPDSGSDPAAARDEPPGAPGAGGAADRGFRLGLWAIPALLGAAGALFAVALWLRARRRGRAEEGDAELAELAELERALESLGYRLAPGTTLLELERRLGAEAGPAAARYARLLRERRFAPPGRRSSGALDRRGLRRALTGPLRGLAKLRGLRALPPRLGRFTPT
jgi:protein-glutamine gamma-glutamyltransferase